MCRACSGRTLQRRKFLAAVVLFMSSGVILIASRTDLTNGFVISEELSVFGRQIYTHIQKKKRGKFHKRQCNVV